MFYSFVRKGPSARDLGCYCAARVLLDWKYIIIIIIGGGTERDIIKTFF